MLQTPRSRTSVSRRSPCPVGCALDLIGDRWTLLIIRDLVSGKQRYGEFLASGEGIPSNLLAERLRRLDVSGIISSRAYQQNPPRYAYELTGKGWDLAKVLLEVARWGMRYIPNAKPGEKLAAFLT